MDFSDWEVSVASVGAAEYRSLFETTRIGITRRATLLAGANNSGKSNVLRFLRDYLQPEPVVNDPDSDRPLGIAPQAWSPRLDLGISIGDMETLVGGRGSVAVLLNALDHDSEYAWFGYKLSPRISGHRESWRFDAPDVRALNWRAWSEYEVVRGSQAVVGASTSPASGHPLDYVAIALDKIAPRLLLELPAVRSIDAFRQIRAGEDGDVGDDGLGLVKQLAKLQNPGMRGGDLREQFDRINDFLRFVINDPTASLNIPHDAKQILVETETGLLPLQSLGTGVHQTIILAAACTITTNSLVCIEEPEVNLHPLLQRRLLEYLVSSTSNRYVVATHSAHLLDSERAHIYHVSHTANAGTVVRPAVDPSSVAQICADLGYRPSDLLQTNTILWVEGPSDRVYLRRWIELLSPAPLVEGIHYSIMFYGGGLLAHLDPNDPEIGDVAAADHEQEVNDFISLRRLNRNLMILIDSDKTSRSARINATKRRVVDAVEAVGGVAWVTSGYTIENYVPRMLLEDAVRVVHPRAKLASGAGPWENPLLLSSTKARSRTRPQPNKNLIARQVVKDWTRETMDPKLVKCVRKVIDLIYVANGRDPLEWRTVRY